MAPSYFAKRSTPQEKRAVVFLTLGTFDFQARLLYEKFGFSVCGAIEVTADPCAFEIQSGDEPHDQLASQDDFERF